MPPVPVHGGTARSSPDWVVAPSFLIPVLVYGSPATIAGDAKLSLAGAGGVGGAVLSAGAFHSPRPKVAATSWLDVVSRSRSCTTTGGMFSLVLCQVVVPSCAQNTPTSVPT